MTAPDPAGWRRADLARVVLLLGLALPGGTMAAGGTTEPSAPSAADSKPAAAPASSKPQPPPAPAKQAKPAGQPAKSASQPQPNPPPPPPENLELLPPNATVGLLGTKVFGPKGEDMGMIADVIVDETGHPRALIIDFGGFLGVGSRKVGIDWRLVHFRPENRDAPVLLRLSRAEVEAAPIYDPNIQPVRIVGPPAGKPATPNASP